MDQDENITEPTLTETKAEEGEGHDGEKPGKVIQTFLVRVTLRENPDGDEFNRAESAVPTNTELENYIESSLYDVLPYFRAESINASAEKV